MATELPVGNITSANSTAVLTVKELFPQGIQLQMFNIDSGVTMEDLTIASTKMTLDGHMVAAYLPNIKRVTVNLEACSPSYEPLSQVFRASESKRGFYEVTLTITIPELNKTFVFTPGVMVAGTPLPGLQQTLQPTRWTFDFGRMYAPGL